VRFSGRVGQLPLNPLLCVLQRHLRIAHLNDPNLAHRAAPRVVEAYDLSEVQVLGEGDNARGSVINCAMSALSWYNSRFIARFNASISVVSCIYGVRVVMPASGSWVGVPMFLAMVVDALQDVAQVAVGLHAGSRAVSIRLKATAATWPPHPELANSHFFFNKATGFIARSLMLLSASRMPYKRNVFSAAQLLTL